VTTKNQLKPHRDSVSWYARTNSKAHAGFLQFPLLLASLYFFDLSRIASLGAIFYIVMDMVVHWVVLKHLRKDVNANPLIVITALVVDGVVLAAFLWIKASSDFLVVWLSFALIIFIFTGESGF